jgi:hypothetical protein
MKMILAALFVGLLVISGGALAEADATTSGGAEASENGAGFANTAVSTFANAAILGGAAALADSGGLAMAIGVSIDGAGATAGSNLFSNADILSISTTDASNAIAGATAIGPNGAYTWTTTQATVVSILGFDKTFAQSSAYSGSV